MLNKAFLWYDWIIPEVFYRRAIILWSALCGAAVPVRKHLHRGRHFGSGELSPLSCFFLLKTPQSTDKTPTDPGSMLLMVSRVKKTLPNSSIVGKKEVEKYDWRCPKPIAQWIVWCPSWLLVCIHVQISIPSGHSHSLYSKILGPSSYHLRPVVGKF